ncbi:alpha/beta fold hydrolase [Cesiribacter andamanensis]|uniref:Soluble epoxide hydrolase n=1 Tax=Cesiribacter andamanensis AMV16 TaxID=1279009 RepID=M7N1N3_9BACT|nr:alpha/beta hydrolase [Cesiribacter andamanensis]EMR01202.1 Soluble epoxide hydrolase [Cesiribacter andamanensis AMV16]
MQQEHVFYRVNGIEMHVVEAGNPKGDILLFLHGFPEYWWGWRHQLAHFASQGYRVVAPDQRGYNRSSKPARQAAYGMRQLSDDIAELIRQLGTAPLTLVGHDWGGAVAWAVALRYPQLLHKLVILNLPHPQAMRQGLRWPRQWLKSWYIGLFQLPLLPEKLLRMGNFALLEQSMLRSAKRGTFSPLDMAHYKEAWQMPGALTAMLNWYRAALQPTLKLSGTISTPTLLLWGKQDQFLSHQMARLSIAQCRQGRLVMLENATHWLHHEQPREVNRLIQQFIDPLAPGPAETTQYTP